MENDINDQEILEINEDDIEEIIFPSEKPEADDLLNEEFEDLDVGENGGTEDKTELKDNSIHKFTCHKGSVFSVHINPFDPSKVVSGGEDDLAYIWSTSDTAMQEIKLDGHKDSVIIVQFSHDGKYIMTADMSGTVLIWKDVSGANVCKLECGDIEWATWHPLAHVVLAGTVDGDVYMWKVPGGECKIFSGHGSRTTCGNVLSQGKRMYVGYEDGSLKLWDLKTATGTFHLSGELGHSEPSTCVASSRSGVLLASGGEDGMAKVYNANGGKLVAIFNVGSEDESKDSDNHTSVECVGFSSDNQLLCTGSLNGSFQVWDLSTQRLRHNCLHPDGVSRMFFSEHFPNSVFTGCLDGHVRLWNLKSGTLLLDLSGHTDNILDISISSDGSCLATGSDDGTARIFSLTNVC